MQNLLKEREVKSKIKAIVFQNQEKDRAQEFLLIVEEKNSKLVKEDENYKTD